MAKVEPIIWQEMASGIQDFDYLDRITDPFYDIVLSSGIGRELYDEYLTYVESFNPQRAKEYRDHDELNGVYDDLVDKQGVDYFEGHLTTVGNAGHDWKEKIVGFLHDAAEDTPILWTKSFGL
ncbi:MAG: hypothetical protein LBC68_07290 [Prevotellaceae bacterium]|nr:hypothetical protein [Prevotellaceae bacterium]